MTMALCFNCGETKFGAICPCGKCGVASTGDVQLDIAFSDHHMSVKTIAAFGAAVRAIAAVEADPPARFWTFIAFISRRHGDILKADVPAELADRVEEALAKATLPEVTVEPGLRPPPPIGPTRLEVGFPAERLQRFQAAQPFVLVTVVDVKLRDGSVWACDLMDLGVRATLIARDLSAKFAADDVVAVRRRRLFRWLPKRPWIS